MRVIGGSSRGRRLTAPELPGLRPTSDKVREAIFDILEARRLVVGARVLDLFCGSGALGIEALSRGASFCTFVDADRRALSGVAENLRAVGLDKAPAELVTSSASDFLARKPARYDLAVVDPPYVFTQWPGLLGTLPAEVAVLEHREEIDIGESFHTIRSYRYGGTLVTLVAAHPTPKDPS